MCPSIAYQGAQTLFIHMIWRWDAVYAGLDPQPWHYNIIAQGPLHSTPIFQKFTHTCTVVKSIRVHSFAHPQHIKVLKHFLYIWYGSGMHSMLVWTSSPCWDCQGWSHNVLWRTYLTLNKVLLERGGKCSSYFFVFGYVMLYLLCEAIGFESAIGQIWV